MAGLSGLLVDLALELPLELIDDVVFQTFIEADTAEVDLFKLHVDFGEGLKEDEFEVDTDHLQKK